MMALLFLKEHELLPLIFVQSLQDALLLFLGLLERLLVLDCQFVLDPLLLIVSIAISDAVRLVQSSCGRSAVHL